MRTNKTVGWAAVLLAAGLWLGGAGCAGRRTARVQEPPGPERLQEAVRLASQAERAMKRGRNDEAIALYRRSIEASPELAAAWHNLGVLLMTEKNYIDAVEAFKVAADQSPADPRPYYMIGVAYHQQGWDQQALWYFSRSLERNPNYIYALRGAVRAARRLDLADRAALERARRALAVDPDETWRKIEQREALRIEGVLRQETSRIELGGPVGMGSGSPPEPAPSAQPR